MEWFQEYEASNKEINWGQFSIDVVSRFSPSAYDNLIGQISKLQQVAMIRAYQQQLKVLMTRTSRLPKEFLVKCFISGLKKAIKKNQVTMFRLSTLA